MTTPCMLVDAYNVLHRGQALYPQKGTPFAEGLQAFVARVQSNQPILAEQVVLVFDGRPPPALHTLRPQSGLNIIFTGPQQSADGRIEEWVDQDPDPSHYCVVSSDRAILEHAASRGCRTMTARSFLEQLDSAQQQTRQSVRKMQRGNRRFRLGDVFPDL